MPPCCGIRTLSGVPGGASASVATSTWTERYLGDATAAPATDLTVAVPPNPTVAIPNTTTTAGQVASCTWTSNAGDVVAAVTQGAVTTFATTVSGLSFVGANATTNMTDTAQQAPHIFCNWIDVLGEDPRGGVDYCLMIRFSASTINTAGQAFGSCIYSPNDAAVEPNIIGNPAINDEKRFAGWIENVSGTLTIIGRQGTTQFQGIQGANIPASFDTVGMVIHAGGGLFEVVVGVSDGGVLPDPDSMAKVPGPFHGGSTTFPSRPMLTPLERLAIAGQQQAGSTYNWTIPTIRVLSRNGRSAP